MAEVEKDLTRISLPISLNFLSFPAKQYTPQTGQIFPALKKLMINCDVLLTVHLSIFIVLLTVHLSIFIVLLTVHLSIFIVLLTVHLSVFISVFNQPDAQNLFHNKFYFMPLHVSSTCAHHQEV